MELSTWILGAATLAVGAILTTATNLLVEGVRRRWQRVDRDAIAQHEEEIERRRRAQGRSEESAGEILALVDEIRGLFHDHPFRLTREEGSTGGPTYDQLRPLTDRVRRLTIDIGDEEVRRRLDLAIEAYEQAEPIWMTNGDNPYRIVWQTSRAIQEAIGALRRGEPIAEGAGFLDEYHAAVLTHFARPPE